MSSAAEPQSAAKPYVPGSRPSKSVKDSRAFRIALPLIVLAVLYWGVYLIGARPERASHEGDVLDPRKAARLVAQSKIKMQEGHYDQALTLARQLADAFPENAVYLENVADLSGRLGDYRQESVYWEKAFRFAPLPVEYCPQLISSYRKQRLIPEMRNACERCLNLDPQNTDTLFYLGLAEEWDRRFEKAGEYYRRVIELAPNYTDALIGMARTALFSGDCERARHIATEALAQRSDEPQALLVLGMAFRAEAKLGEAKKHLNRALEINNDDADVHVVLGGIAEQEKDSELALRHYSKALQLDPNRREVAARRDGLLKGRP